MHYLLSLFARGVDALISCGYFLEVILSCIDNSGKSPTNYEYLMIKQYKIKISPTELALAWDGTSTNCFVSSFLCSGEISFDESESDSVLPTTCTKIF